MNDPNNQADGGEDELVLGSEPHGGAPEVEPGEPEAEVAPKPEDHDAVTATRKFNWTDAETETTRTFFPGQLIDIEDAAMWALDQKHGEQRGLQSPARSHAINAPNNKARSLEGEGGENKSGKANRPKKR